ncbi:MAG: hypothetical protein MUP22_06990 [Desulfobacterales bacterium]|nr:hypothetical protein [Desulfobacterales bacterium]
MKQSDLYLDGHIFIAAIRILQHLNNTAPSIEEVCKLLSLSFEQGNFICRKLKEMEIIDVVEGSYGTRLFIKNHLKLEDIKIEEPEDKLAQELMKFQADQKEKTKKLESFQAEQEAKKKNLFSDLEKKLQDELKKKGNGK